MTELSTQHENQNFIFKIEVNHNQSINSVYSSSFSVVYWFVSSFKLHSQYQLEIRNIIPNEWYKDEGGKRNHIPLSIGLVVFLFLKSLK